MQTDTDTQQDEDTGAGVVTGAHLTERDAWLAARDRIARGMDAGLYEASYSLMENGEISGGRHADMTDRIEKYEQEIGPIDEANRLELCEQFAKESED
jgi:hypothetical protein